MEKANIRNGVFKRMINKLLMPKAYVEALEILKHIPLEDYNRIPTEIIENMELNSDKEYHYTITNFHDFQELTILSETETILAVLYRDYWATDEERNRIFKKEKEDFLSLEEEKRKKYNPDDLFKKTNNTSENIENIQDTQEIANTSLIKYKESFFTKLKEFILKIIYKEK